MFICCLNCVARFPRGHWVSASHTSYIHTLSSIHPLCRACSRSAAFIERSLGLEFWGAGFDMQDDADVDVLAFLGTAEPRRVYFEV